MADAIADQLRAELRAALAANDDRLRDAIRGELARKVVLEPGRRMQVEVDPFFYGITSCASEEPVLEDWLDSSLPTDWFDRAEQALGGWDCALEGRIVPVVRGALAGIRWTGAVLAGVLVLPRLPQRPV